MKKNELKWLIFLIVFFIIYFLYLKRYNCYRENKIIQSLNNKNAVCIKAIFKKRNASRSGTTYIIRHFEKYDDTCFGFNLCSEFLNGSYIPERLENTTFFVIYDKENDKSVLPVWTKKSYEVLKKYFPDSAKLVDTSLFE